jgi:hypothetical protein
VEDLLRTHGEGADTAARLIWLAAYAERYARHELTDYPRFISIAPRRAITWLEAGCPPPANAAAGPSVARASPASPTPSAEASEAQYREVLRWKAEAVPPPDLVAALNAIGSGA